MVGLLLTAIAVTVVVPDCADMATTLQHAVSRQCHDQRVTARVRDVGSPW
jgi:hypothetical protein